MTTWCHLGDLSQFGMISDRRDLMNITSKNVWPAHGSSAPFHGMSTFNMLCLSTPVLQISPVNLENALLYCTFADLQQIWPAKVTILRVRIAIFYVMWTDAAIRKREAASTTRSTLSSPYGRARPHHMEYCHPHPKNSYFRGPNFLQI